MENRIERLVAAISEAISGRRCVSAWLGYGNVLFLGFGSEIVPPRDPHDRRTMPPFELQNAMADWRIDGPIPADSQGEEDIAERAVGALIGLPVANWGLIDDRGLEVEFDGGWRLEIVPPSEVDPGWSDLHEWWLRLPDASYVGIGLGGGVVSGRTDDAR